MLLFLVEIFDFPLITPIIGNENLSKAHEEMQAVRRGDQQKLEKEFGSFFGVTDYWGRKGERMIDGRVGVSKVRGIGLTRFRSRELSVCLNEARFWKEGLGGRKTGFLRSK